MDYEDRTVTDQVLLLGLDHLYRARMKHHESSELLACANEVADALALPPSHEPVEGYYTESQQLATYFRLMRALQSAGEHLRSEVASLAGYRRLVEVTSSPIFGVPVRDDRLLHKSRDSLFDALDQTPVSDWTVTSLMAAAVEIASSSDDCSLVALAVLSHDAALVTALRETMVLYAAPAFGAARHPPTPRYIWEVGKELARRAEVFVDRFNSLFTDDLPRPRPDNAARLWSAHNEAVVAGRCVRIGLDDSTKPVRHYHWAVSGAWKEKVLRYEVHEFWDTILWTSEAYRLDPNSPQWKQRRRLSN